MKGPRRIRVDMPDHSARIAGFERPGEGMGPAIPCLWGLYILSFLVLALRQEAWIDPWPGWKPGEPAVLIGPQGELHALLTMILAVLQLIHIAGIFYLVAIVLDVRYRRTGPQVIEQGVSQLLAQGLVLLLLWTQLSGEWAREDYFQEHAPWDRGHCCGYEAYGLPKRPAWLMGPDVWVTRHETEEGEVIAPASGPVVATDASGKILGAENQGSHGVPGASIGPPRKLARIEGLGALEGQDPRPGGKPRPREGVFVPLDGQPATSSWGDEPTPVPVGQDGPPPLVGDAPEVPATGTSEAQDPDFHPLEGETAVSEW